MNLLSWFQRRGPGFVIERGRSVINRYGFSSKNAIKRIDRIMDCLSDFNCSPTFPVPGMVVEKHPNFIRSLQDRGAEIAVHGYNHINLSELKADLAVKQLLKAVDVFVKYDLVVHGFRAPYLSSNDEIIDSLPENIFDYSSNQAVRWDIIQKNGDHEESDLFSTINKFYIPEAAKRLRCLPWLRSGLIEIPVSVPDDLQMMDGLGYQESEITEAWLNLVDYTYQRGEVFNLMFHPELSVECLEPFSKLLDKARSYKPGIWLARLCDIAGWWREKATINPTIRSKSTGVSISINSSSRENWVVSGIEIPGSVPWDGKYNKLIENTVNLLPGIRPFIGVDGSIPSLLVRKLANQGYIIDTSQHAIECSIFLNQDRMTNLHNEAAVVDMIESASTPLIRLWPWPDGYRSAMCITGDLDALSLLDYANRIITN